MGIFRLWHVRWNVFSLEPCNFHPLKLLLLHLHKFCVGRVWHYRCWVHGGLQCCLEHRKKCERVAVGGSVFVACSGQCIANTELHPLFAVAGQYNPWSWTRTTLLSRHRSSKQNGGSWRRWVSVSTWNTLTRLVTDTVGVHWLGCFGCLSIPQQGLLCVHCIK